MLIRKVKELSLKLRELTPKQLEDWWSGFRRRRHISARRVTSYRRGMDEVVLPLVRCYRAVLHGYRVWGTSGVHTVYRAPVSPLHALCGNSSMHVQHEQPCLANVVSLQPRSRESSSPRG